VVAPSPGKLLKNLLKGATIKGYAKDGLRRRRPAYLTSERTVKAERDDRAGFRGLCLPWQNGHAE
jgi:hypothetical protein